MLYIRIILSYALLIITSFMLLIFFATTTHADPGLNENSILQMYYHWGDSPIVNGIPVGISEKDWISIGNIDDLNDKKDNYLWVRIKLPDHLVCRNHCALFANWIQEDYEVYLNQEKIYSFGKMGSTVFSGWDFSLISLGAEPQGKMLYLRIFSEFNTIGPKGFITVDSKANLIQYIYDKDLPRVVIPLIMLFLAVYFLIIFYRNSRQKEFLYFSLYLVFYSIYFISRTDVKNLFYYNPFLWTYAMFYGIFIAPLFFLLFLYRFLAKKQLYLILFYIYLLFACIVLVLDLTSIITVQKTIDIFDALLVITILLLVHSVFRIRRNTDFVILRIGFLVYMILGMFDTLMNLYHNVSVQPIAQYGIFVLIIAILIVHGRRINEASLNLKIYAQELAEKNAELTRLNNVKDEFLAKTSHELRTPLHGIIGISESILDGIGGKMNEVAAKHLRIVVGSAQRLNNLVNDILDFSKLKHKDIVLGIESVDMAMLSENVVIANKSLIKDKSIELRNLIAQPIYVLGDSDRLQQILYNLIGNAIKFTFTGTITVSAEKKGTMVEITVADTGIGIREEQFNNVFEAFEQIDDTVPRAYGGTGLGLPITKHLVELHHGSIRIESVIGKGSKLMFTLPLAEIIPVETKTIPAPSIAYLPANSPIESSRIIHKGGVLVLIVDDDPVNVQVMINHLTLHNWGSIVAYDGFQALDILSKERIDLVLLDVMMPRMSGFEVCERIRETYSSEELPIIMLTAKSSSDDIARGFEAGANDYLTKPFIKNELVARIEARIKLKAKKEIFTKTEKEVLYLYYENPSTSRKQMLELFNNTKAHPITEKTLSVHITNILKKIDAESMGEAALKAKERGQI